MRTRKQIIRLNESQLKRIIKESVNEVLLSSSDNNKIWDVMNEEFPNVPWLKVDDDILGHTHMGEEWIVRMDVYDNGTNLIDTIELDRDLNNRTFADADDCLYFINDLTLQDVYEIICDSIDLDDEDNFASVGFDVEYKGKDGRYHKVATTEAYLPED